MDPSLFFMDSTGEGAAAERRRQFAQLPFSRAL
jgi:hypothetical protein